MLKATYLILNLRLKTYRISLATILLCSVADPDSVSHYNGTISPPSLGAQQLHCMLKFILSKPFELGYVAAAERFALKFLFFNCFTFGGCFAFFQCIACYEFSDTKIGGQVLTPFPNWCWSASLIYQLT